MTERGWLRAKTIGPLQVWCVNRRKREPRRERLFACACCRRLWDQLNDPRSRFAIEASEDFADGVIDKPALARARREATRATLVAPHLFDAPEQASQLLCNLHPDDVFSSTPARVLSTMSHFRLRAMRKEQAAQASLLRDIFGNPFRPVSFSPNWRTDTAVSLARQMYESRQFGAVPILADALQDAGCDNPDILDHCRDTTLTHVRGCWVVDLVLNKS